MLRPSAVWIWTGRGVATLIVFGLAGYLYVVGLDTANKFGSAVGGLAAVVALAMPYLFPPRQPQNIRTRPDTRGEMVSSKRTVNQLGRNNTYIEKGAGIHIGDIFD